MKEIDSALTEFKVHGGRMNEEQMKVVEQFVTSPLCLVGYVRWDARSDRVPPLQTIIFSSFTGRTKSCRLSGSWRIRLILGADETDNSGLPQYSAFTVPYYS